MLVAIEIVAPVVAEAMPYAIVLAFSQRLVNMFLSAAFGGYLRI